MEKTKEFLRTFFPVVITVLIIGLALIVWRGGWPDDVAPLQLQYLGVSLIVLVIALVIWQVFKDIKSISATILGNSVSINDETDSGTDKGS